MGSRHARNEERKTAGSTQDHQSWQQCEGKQEDQEETRRRRSRKRRKRCRSTGGVDGNNEVDSAGQRECRRTD